MRAALFTFLMMLTLLPGTIRAEKVLVDTQWLASHLRDPDLRLIDMSSDELQYRRFHIPGAARLDYENLVTVRKDKVVVRIDDERFAKLLGLLGITPRHHVVIYDDMGGLNAGRLYWMLERFGHARMSVLDGGLVRWILDGRPLDNQPVALKPVDYPVPQTLNTGLEIGLEEIRQLTPKSGVTLLDVRTEEEYTGHPRYPRSGHIPNARWWPWEVTFQIEQGFTHHSLAKLEASLAQAGVTRKDQPLVLYCNTGHRASQAYLTLRHLGFSRLHLYDASMMEYSRNPAVEIRQGMQP